MNATFGPCIEICETVAGQQHSIQLARKAGYAEDCRGNVVTVRTTNGPGLFIPGRILVAQCKRVSCYGE